ncbi:hypothetical protein DSO57_1021022 [Entomophthora muscae]|uniref:Uncharacterized protein n=2 Tax=Entomophthora muscae TaxID=34485 RepID=A0ACC2RUM8_9FUNG|nr:hypothetical protein DSO57_1021022 [Entomophthora muscae]
MKLGLLALPSAWAIGAILTPENYTQVIQNGTWFIFFRSSRCGHCIQFMPVWKELSAEYEKGAHSAVSFGSVDCYFYRNLCSNINHTPTLNLYRDGEYVEEYTRSGVESVQSMVDFLVTKTNPSTTAEVAAQ